MEDFKRDTRIDEYIDKIEKIVTEDGFNIPKLVELKLNILDLENLLLSKYHPEITPFYDRYPVKEFDKFLTGVYGLTENKYNTAVSALSLIKHNLYSFKEGLTEYRILDLVNNNFDNKKILKLGLNIDVFIKQDYILAFLEKLKRANKLYDEVIENKNTLLLKSLHLEDELYTFVDEGVYIYEPFMENGRPYIKTKEYTFEKRECLKIFYREGMYTKNDVYFQMEKLFKKHFPQFYI